MPAITITLKDRVRMYAEAVGIARSKQAQLAIELAEALDQLAKAEAEVLGKAAGWEEVGALSGLIEEGKNPYYEPPVPSAAMAAAEAAGVGHGVRVHTQEDEEKHLPPADEGEENTTTDEPEGVSEKPKKGKGKG